MGRYIKTALVLAAICAVAAVVLALMNMLTKPYIDAYEADKVTSALEKVSCGMEIGQREEINSGYVQYMHILGLVSNGYGGQLTIVASYDTAGVVMAAKLIADSETPGLGKKAENDNYMKIFAGTGSASVPVPTKKTMLSDADAAVVSGASITFGGISKALANGSDFVKSL